MAEKNPLSPEGIHKRLQVVEVVVFISLALNVVQGYFTIHNHNQMNQIQSQVGR